MSMASNTAILAVKVISDTRDAQRGLGDLNKTADTTRASFDRVAGGAAIALAAVGALATASVGAASDLEQATGAVEAVYGAYADTVISRSKAAADAVGLSASAYDNLAAIIGSQLKTAGTPMDQLADKTDALIGLGSDLAATYGGTVGDAVNAVSSLLRGERDPIERYGVSIKQAQIDAYKLANGLSGLTGEADAQADAQAALAILYQQTADAQGQFAEESDTLANSQQTLNAKWENAQAALGEILLPILSIAADVLGKLAGWATENQTAFQILVGVLIAAAAAIWLVNIAMYANPIGLVIAAVALLIAIIVLLVANWETIADVAADVWGSVIDWIVEVGKWFGDVFGAIGRWWDDLMQTFSDGFNALFGWVNDALGWLGSLVGLQSAAGAPANMVRVQSPSGVAGFTASPGLGGSLVRASRFSAPAGAGVVNITVNGALDPDAVGQQIRRLLNRTDARVGLRPSTGSR